MTGQQVRITLDGVAQCDPDGQILRMRMGGTTGPLVLISKAWPGVAVEDVTPAREWTNGDVIDHNGDVWVRVAGQWRAVVAHRVRLTDAEADRTLAMYPQTTQVVRYQAGA